MAFTWHVFEGKEHGLERDNIKVGRGDQRSDAQGYRNSVYSEKIQQDSFKPNRSTGSGKLVGDGFGDRQNLENKSSSFVQNYKLLFTVIGNKCL